MQSFHLGFTGTAKGITPLQKKALVNKLYSLLNGSEAWLHHGSCIGADVTAHEVAKTLGYKIHIHPPKNSKKLSVLTGDRTAAPRNYLDRNYDIVKASKLLLAIPDGPERLRSGTWATVRFARRLGREVIIILPNGTEVEERGKGR